MVDEFKIDGRTLVSERHEQRVGADRACDAVYVGVYLVRRAQRIDERSPLVNRRVGRSNVVADEIDARVHVTYVGRRHIEARLGERTRRFVAPSHADLDDARILGVLAAHELDYLFHAGFIICHG